MSHQSSAGLTVVRGRSEGFCLHSFLVAVRRTFCGFSWVLRCVWISRRDPKIVVEQDELTGALARAEVLARAQREFERARRYRRPFSLALLDLDDFKFLNDTHGHQAGDQRLQEVATILRVCHRPTDFVSRMGGDEFLVVLPETDREGAAGFLARAEGVLSPVSISVGIASVDWSQDQQIMLEQLIERADREMYRVKRSKKGTELQPS